MSDDAFPNLALMGVTGVLVRFAGQLSEPANRAALAFRAAAEAEGWPGVVETSSTLASTYLRVDPGQADPRDVAARAQALLQTRDWLAEPLPSGRKLWRIPTAWGGEMGPDLTAAAAAAGLSEPDAIAMLSSARVRVLTLGFSPGQPYLGQLPPAWDLPRRTGLAQVPAGALVQAVRQFVLFAAPNPTGWRHIGQTAFRPFRVSEALPIPLTPGDEVVFEAAPPDRIAALSAAGDTIGGAVSEALP